MTGTGKKTDKGRCPLCLCEQYIKRIGDRGSTVVKVLCYKSEGCIGCLLSSLHYGTVPVVFSGWRSILCNGSLYFLERP